MTSGRPTRNAPGLIGRAAEIIAVEQLLDKVAHQGAALVLRGDAGVGKSALLDNARDLARARGFGVLSAIGVESEANLPYAGLHQLLQPVLHQAAQLAPQLRTALLAAFGMADAGGADRFLTALAALELLTDAAHEKPQIVVVDDAQWLDTTTLDALGFIARRIAVEPLVMMIAVREGHLTPLTELTGTHLRHIAVGPLDEGSALALLDTVGRELARPARDRVLSAAQGNPLALTELPAGLQSGGVETQFTQHLPLTERLRRAFTARLTDLPGPTQRLLLLAAADDGTSLAEILAAAAELGETAVSTATLEEAVAAGLIRMDLAEVRFRHPLMRSAIYQASTLTDRRRAHSALAAELRHQPDRRAWHLAASALAPDEDVANEIGEAAERAQAQGALTVAIAALARSAELTADARRRARRLLRAADLASQIGDLEDLQRLVGAVDIEQLGRAEQAQYELLRNSTEPMIPGDAAKVSWLASTGETLAYRGHIDLALRFLEAAATQANLADPGKAARTAVTAAALRIGAEPDDPRLLAILAFAEPEEHGALIVQRAAAIANRPPVDPESAALLGASLNVVGAFDLSASFLAAAVAGLRDQGRLSRLPLVLTHQAWTAINTMDWATAIAAAEESVRLADEVGQPLWGAGARTAVAMLAGLRGDYGTADAESRAAESIALPTRASAMLAGIRLTRGVAALAAGMYDTAYDELRRMLDPADPSYHYFQSFWGVGDFAEAALHSGHLEAGRAVLADLEVVSRTVHSPWLQVGLMYGRPLLAQDVDVEGFFRQALASDLSHWPVYRARLLLQYGIWLRRRRRVTDSRAPLRAAIDALETLRVTGWAALAHQELRASGEASAERAPEAWSLLTSQELQIARMAADGMSNREIGQRLFLSHRTVGSHLYRLFPKLGVSSRAQLSVVIGNRPAP